VSEYQVERPRNLAEIQCIDEQPGVPDLAPAATAHETSKLLLGGPSFPLRLLLQGAERSKLSLSVDDLFYGVRTEGTNQLVFQVCDAHVEAESFHLDAGEVRAEAGPLETAPEVVLLSGVTEARDCDGEPLRAEQVQEASDSLCTSHCDDRDALGVEIPSTAFGEGFERALVADSFDKDHRTQVDARGPRVFHIPYLHSSRCTLGTS
jgi:hypothetical protein